MIARLICSTICAVAAIVFASTAAHAQTCSFSATDINFGTVDTLGSNATDVSGTITVNCSALLGLLSSISGNINIGEGSGGGDSGARQMTSSSTSTSLNYQLYKDAARTVVLGGDNWVNGESIDLSSFSVLIIGGSGTANVPFYGRVFGAQEGVAPGNYLSSFFRDPIDVRVAYRTCNLLLICTNRTATLTFDVLAQVEKNCLVSATDLDFGTVGVLSSPIDAASQISVTCTAQTDYHIGLDNGLYGMGPLDRYMRSAASDAIRYGLYQDASRSIAWGSLADGAALSGAGSGNTQTYPVYGRVPSQDTPPSGTYADTIVVTITY
ncbi:Csu type fimbrial protein [Roseinatronobacter bogoriensis]|uniref:SCPU domain-containing protein n=1 Tax=Roseinatronobacter bogoriensis subsp. barguzinensis TaxID=441209 RepID=A0A2K8K6J1_9RHOB|nr:MULTISPECIES: spore coat U domain-containing protein [Rhodobaca]ATX64546.1 SCPU domain-containing protein [Rhodobaca barguzinensis]MBB4209726.1 spore coat protein U-like protein [Rhodobaca bogoriensis DSM 18756]TDW33722.1 spore coat protein U-like protein [Rhodobaca barguzinensis]TDY66193.1 spore coat protein U-like protein [Rhodobaca bogoriensis DSM 18756]